MKALVIGGGLAGISAALELAESGWEVTLLEKLGVSGGRARVIEPKGFGVSLDYGQHLLMGAYKETLTLARRVNSESEFEVLRGKIVFVERRGRASEISGFGSPLLARAAKMLLSLKHLALKDRLALGKVAIAAKLELKLRGDALDNESAESWLISRGQSQAAIAGFWEPLILAVMNLPSSEASAGLFAVTLEKAFFADASSASPILPKTTLHNALIAPALRKLESLGAKVVFNSKVEALETSGDIVRTAIAKSGEKLEAQAFVLAVDSQSALKLFRNVEGMGRMASHCEQLGISAITTAFYKVDAPFLGCAYAGAIGAEAQWVFERPLEGGGALISVVISGEKRKGDKGGEGERLGRIWSELNELFPTSRKARIEASVLMRAKDATIRAGVGQKRLRAIFSSSIYKNLFIAGDWTDTGLPATIEGAVKSGFEAARLAERAIKKSGKAAK